MDVGARGEETVMEDSGVATVKEARDSGALAVAEGMVAAVLVEVEVAAAAGEVEAGLVEAVMAAGGWGEEAVVMAVEDLEEEDLVEGVVSEAGAEEEG